MDLLIDWLYVNNLVSLKGGESTHVLLTGGRFFIPLTHTESFLDRYATSVCNGETRMSFIERSGQKKYRMFADIDIYEDADIEDLLDDILHMLPYPLMNKRICILRREFHNGKQGLHLIWPDTFVSDQDGRALCEGWILKLPLKYKTLVDLSVYRNNGLRMPWSVKPTGGTKTMYIPWRIVTSSLVDGISVTEQFPRRDHLEFEDVRKWLGLCVLYPKDFKITIERANGLKGTNGLKGRNVRNEPDGLVGSSSIVGDNNVSRVSLLLARVLGNNTGNTVRKLVFNKNAVVIHTKERCCLIADRVHTSNHVYYTVEWEADDVLVIRQRCFNANCKGKVRDILSIDKESDCYTDLASIMANVNKKVIPNIRPMPLTPSLCIESLLKKMKL